MAEMRLRSLRSILVFDEEVDPFRWQRRGEIQNTGEMTEHGKRGISVPEMAKEVRRRRRRRRRRKKEEEEMCERKYKYRSSLPHDLLLI